jgi:hypothetical protein
METDSNPRGDSAERGSELRASVISTAVGADGRLEYYAGEAALKLNNSGRSNVTSLGNAARKRRRGGKP